MQQEKAIFDAGGVDVFLPTNMDKTFVTLVLIPVIVLALINR